MMDAYEHLNPVQNRKRKPSEFPVECSLDFSMDELNDDLLEAVLSWLPTSAFIRLTSVCKRWKSVAESESFKLACSRISSRDPWFFMVDRRCLNQWIVFDSAEDNWKKLSHLTSQSRTWMPVASSGGLVCLRDACGSFSVVNPVTGLSREVQELPVNDSPLNAISMSTKPGHSYKLVLVYGEIPKLSFKVYDSSLDRWEEEASLSRPMDHHHQDHDPTILNSTDESDGNVIYFLSKAGNVVATNLQRSPSKQYSSVMTVKNGHEMVYFLSPSGTIVACNLTRNTFTEYPRLLPAFLEYSIDIIETGGEILIVLLSEFFESASLRIWRYDERARAWCHVAAMPPSMSHEFFGKKGDINCVGADDKLLVCFSSPELSKCIMYDLVGKKWRELPRCFSNGEAVDFVSAISLEPRIEELV